MATELELQREWTRRLQNLCWKVLDIGNAASLDGVIRTLGDEMAQARTDLAKMEEEANKE